MKTLTIGIPTYKRKRIVEETIAELAPSLISNSDVELLVIDDASGEGDLSIPGMSISGEPSVRVIENEVNLGLTGNICKLFMESRSRYLMILSDEDTLVLENIPGLISFLQSANPGFVSPQFLKDQGNGFFVYRGRKKKSLVKPGDFHSSSFYLSGLVYPVSESLDIINEINGMKDWNLAAFIYPQVLLTSNLILKGKCFWLDLPVTRQKHSLEPNVKHKDDTSYNRLIARWEQYNSIIDALSYFEEKERTGPGKKIFSEMIRLHKNNLYHWIYWGLAVEDKELLKILSSGCKRHMIKSRLSGIKNLLWSLFPFAGHNKAEKKASTATKATWGLTRDYWE